MAVTFSRDRTRRYPLKLTTLMLISALAPASAASAMPGPLPFIADDYGRARAEAARRQIPLFVDVWAPW